MGDHLKFWGCCAKRAATGGIDRANAWGPLVGACTIWLVLSVFGLEVIVSDKLPGLIFLALAYLTAAWLTIFLFRTLFIEPSRLSGEAQEEVSVLKCRIEQLEERQRPKLKVFLNPVDGGVQELPTVVGHQHGPASKWVQFSVSCATDAPVTDCEPWLKSVVRLSDGEELVEEDVNCGWSQLSDKKITIARPREPRANLFTLYAHQSGIQLQVTPTKVRLREGIQLPGRYRVTVFVTAQGVPSAIESFIFEWRDFNTVTLMPAS